MCYIGFLFFLLSVQGYFILLLMDGIAFTSERSFGLFSRISLFHQVPEAFLPQGCMHQFQWDFFFSLSVSACKSKTKKPLGLK